MTPERVKFSTWRPGPPSSFSQKFADHWQLNRPWILTAYVLAPMPLFFLPFSALQPIFYLVCVGIFFFVGYKNCELRTPKGIERMMDLPAQIHQYPVSVLFSVQEPHANSRGKRGKAPAGLDRGLVSFVDGLIVFQGTRSNFSIEAKDLVPGSGKSKIQKTEVYGDMSMGGVIPKTYSFL